MRVPGRRGVVSIMLTLALGVAIGAATLLVGTEVAKNLEPPPPASAGVALTSAFPANSARELEEAFQGYQAARRLYDKAVAARVQDLRAHLAVLRKAKQRLERAVILNTPGLPLVEPVFPGSATPTGPATGPSLAP